VLGQKQVSYGNMSARHDADVFWMSGRGVNKAKLDVIGKDILRFHCIIWPAMLMV